MKPENYLNPTIGSEKSLRTGLRLIRFFHPIGNCTNPLWIICSPVLVPIFKSTSPYREIAPLLEEKAKALHRSRRALVRDLAYSMFAFGALPVDYFDLEFWKLSNRGKSSYVTEVSRFFFYPQFNDLSKQDIFDDKLKANAVFGKWYRRECIGLCTQSDIPSCIYFFQRHSSGILKPLNGSLGRGVQRIRLSDLGDPVEFFRNKLLESQWILEEEIVQGDVLSKIHPSSVNTVRVHTVTNQNGDVRIFCPYLRMGRHGSITDNYSSGGSTVMVDPETGITFGTVLPFDQEHPLTHPDTGCQVVGIQLPEWERARKMAVELARVFPDFHFIGWDFSYSKDFSWLLVEANCRPGTTAWQELRKHGMKEDYAELLKWSLTCSDKQ